MTHEHHLLTGATGFLGTAFVLELLDRRDAIITCLVRPQSGASADSRVRTAVGRVARLFDRTDLLPHIDERCRGIAGDIAEPQCSTDPADLGRVDQVWHLAACLSFKPDQRKRLFELNIGGTEHAVALADRCRAPMFNYISTAYVAGTRNGLILEQPVPEDSDTHNWYERSKVHAEALVQRSGLPCTRIFRPSMVFGHSRTFATTSDGTVYGVSRAIGAACRELPDTVGAVLRTGSWQVVGRADSTLNLIPVDRVAAAAVEIASATTTSRIYHLTNVNNCRIGDLAGALADVFGIEEPEFADTRDDFTDVDRLIDTALGEYRPYAFGDKRFDVTNVRTTIGDGYLDYPISRSRLAAFLRWHTVNRATPRSEAPRG
ncbi:SDR family oxidoreductase [Nocardia terpenica]|nr:SDR family oxidoreductase [Nocardia terpenica]